MVEYKFVTIVHLAIGFLVYVVFSFNRCVLSWGHQYIKHLVGYPPENFSKWVNYSDGSSCSRSL